VYVLPDDEMWEMMHDRKGATDVMLVADGHRLLFPGGARLGLVDDPYTPPQPLPLGGWRAVGLGRDAKRYLAFGWREVDYAGRWSEARVAVISIALPTEARGQSRPIALSFSAARVNARQPVQRYRISLDGQVLAQGALGKPGGVVSFIVPPELTRRRSLHLAVELPNATSMTPLGTFPALLLAHIWIAARPDEQPPLPPPVASELP
jgi:hypothetical protein